MRGRKALNARAVTLRAVLLATAAGLSAPSAMAADAAVERETIVSGVTVQGAQREQESRDSYKITRSTSATKTDSLLIDVPQAVSVVSIKQINDQAAASIGDAIRYTPGVYSAQGEGNRETLVFRGNSTTGDFFVDGVRDDVQTYRDLYNIDRLEIFRGPNAMIFGRGGIGGVINRVTKVAGWQTTREVRDSWFLPMQLFSRTALLRGGSGQRRPNVNKFGARFKNTRAPVATLPVRETSRALNASKTY